MQWGELPVFVVVYAAVLIVLRAIRVVKPRTRRLKGLLCAHFPQHVYFRGFASAAFQERGGYASDTDTHRIDGVWTDWSWRKPACKPSWASGALPMMFSLGNGHSERMKKILH